VEAPRVKVVADRGNRLPVNRRKHLVLLGAALHRHGERQHRHGAQVDAEVDRRHAHQHEHQLAQQQARRHVPLRKHPALLRKVVDVAHRITTTTTKAGHSRIL